MFSVPLGLTIDGTFIGWENFFERSAKTSRVVRKVVWRSQTDVKLGFIETPS